MKRSVILTDPLGPDILHRKRAYFESAGLLVSFERASN